MLYDIYTIWQAKSQNTGYCTWQGQRLQLYLKLGQRSEWLPTKTCPIPPMPVTRSQTRSRHHPSRADRQPQKANAVPSPSLLESKGTKMSSLLIINEEGDKDTFKVKDW